MTALAIAGVVLLVAAVLIFVPLGAIWALNVLFGLGIPATLKTWAAAAILCALVGGTRGRKS